MFVRNLALIGILALVVSSCAVKPERLDSASAYRFAERNLAEVTANQESVVGNISLYDAMARAIKYNLDFQVEIYNEFLKSDELAVARLEVLPSLVANSSYNGRSNEAGGTTAVLRSDKSRFNGDITLSWNILDFGLSYIRAKQAADTILIAEERRRKIINRVIGDVRTAYWRAVSANRLISGLQRLTKRVRYAISNSEALQQEGVSSPLTALTYQRELVEIQQQIQALQLELSVAKTQLAALMNISPGRKFKLSPGKIRTGLGRLRITTDEMINSAMENRPEIRDLQYKLRINDSETKSALLELLPSANIFAGANIDTDSFLLNSNWVGWGAKASWNLMRVFQYPAKKRLIQSKENLLKKRALAVTMAIMTQVYVSKARYRHVQKIYFTADKHLRIQREILRQIRESAAADQASEQTLIREEMNTLASRAKRDIAYADLQNAYANIYTAMGLDPYKSDILLKKNVNAISASLRSLWIERGAQSGALRLRKRISKPNQSGASSNSGSLVATEIRRLPNAEIAVVQSVEDSNKVGANEDKELQKSGFFSRLAERRKRRRAIKQPKQETLPLRANKSIVTASEPTNDNARTRSSKKPNTARKPGIFSRLASRRKQRISDKSITKSETVEKPDEIAIPTPAVRGAMLVEKNKKPGFFSRLAARSKSRKLAEARLN